MGNPLLLTGRRCLPGPRRTLALDPPVARPRPGGTVAPCPPETQGACRNDRRTILQVQQRVTRCIDTEPPVWTSTTVADLQPGLPPTWKWRLPPMLGFPAIGAGANSGTLLSSSRGKSHRQNHLPPDRIAGIMPASRGWFPGAKGRERGDGPSIGAIHPYDVRRHELDRPKES